MTKIYYCIRNDKVIKKSNHVLNIHSRNDRALSRGGVQYSNGSLSDRILLEEPTLNRIVRAHDLGKRDLKSSNNIHLISKIAQELNFKRKLSIWYTNATSLNNKLDELRLLTHIHRPDVVCVTETWFNDESDVFEHF